MLTVPMNLDFKHILDTSFPELSNHKLLIAVSGGVDSMVLWHLCHHHALDIAIAHVNFNLRGAASNADEQLVRTQAQSYDTMLHVHQANTTSYAAKNGLNIQLAAREIRYAFFEELCEEHGYKYVLTAHHQDDQLETFLMHLNRGSGVRGLTAIPARNGLLIRPLLKVTRANIVAYATHHQLQWREDASNQKDDYQRNALRHHLIPQVKKQLPQLEQHFSQTVDYLREAQQLIDDEVQRFRESVTQDHNSEYSYRIPWQRLVDHAAPMTILHHLIEPLGFKNIQQVWELQWASPGKHVQGGSYIAHSKQDCLMIQPGVRQIDEVLTVHIGDHDLWGYGRLVVEEVLRQEALQAVERGLDKNTCFLCTDAIAGTLQIRPWQKGDRIQPYGMHGSKLVSDLLTDAKVSFIEKEKTLVLEDQKNILWVLGHRSSKHHTIHKDSKSILKLTLVL